MSRADLGTSYKALGATATDETGTLDGAEFINISRDDALSYPTPTHRTYPSTVNARMESTITPFVRKSVDINLTLMRVLNDKLGLPEGALEGKHALEEHSGSEARCIKSPTNQEMSAEKAALGAHTDFGSLVSRPGSLPMQPCQELAVNHHPYIVLPSQPTRRTSSHAT